MPAAAPPVEAARPSASAPASRHRRPWWRPLLTVWQYVVGAILCQYLLLAVIVVGWTYRLMRRSTIRQWWRLSESPAKGDSYHAFLAAHAKTDSLHYWPNWLVGTRPSGTRAAEPASGLFSRLRRWSRRPAGSLIKNARIGGMAIFNTWVLTLPACSLWLFGWYAGWDNSFNKGYEQAWVGPAVGWLGVLLFLAAMFYVPLAQARQAATGDWRTFYQFRLVRTLARHHWRGSLLLAGLYAGISIPITFLDILPTAYPSFRPEILEMTDAEMVEVLRSYYFRVCLVGFGAFVLLKLAGARLYARALVGAIRDGVIAPQSLHPNERGILQRLDLATPAPRVERPMLVRAVGWAGGRVFRTAGAVVTFLLWFSFIAQIFVSEFLNYHPVIGWLNQPLVQLPLFAYLPPHLTP